MNRQAILTLAALLLPVACADPQSDEDRGGDVCGPNASFSEDHGHCHCDDGFEKIGTACLVDDSDDEENDATTTIDLSGAVITGQSTAASDGSAVYIVQAVAGDTVARIEGYVGFGAPESPASVSLSGDELDYATCSVCVLVQQGCAAHDDHFHCDRTLMPSGGDVVFESLILGDTIGGHLHEVALQEVTIADDFRSTPVTGGVEATIGHWQFSADLGDG
jgi:hypothetical protein